MVANTALEWGMVGMDCSVMVAKPPGPPEIITPPLMRGASQIVDRCGRNGGGRVEKGAGMMMNPGVPSTLVPLLRWIGDEGRGPGLGREGNRGGGLFDGLGGGSSFGSMGASGSHG